MSINLILSGVQKELYYITQHNQFIRRVKISEVTSMTNPIGGKKKYFIMLESGLVCVFKEGEQFYYDGSGMTFFYNPLKVKADLFKAKELTRMNQELAEKRMELRNIEYRITELSERIQDMQRRSDLNITGLEKLQEEYIEILKTESQKKPA